MNKLLWNKMSWTKDLFRDTEDYEAFDCSSAGTMSASIRATYNRQYIKSLPHLTVALDIKFWPPSVYHFSESFYTSSACLACASRHSYVFNTIEEAQKKAELFWLKQNTLIGKLANK
jgi:hypothetical protein